LGPKAGTTFKKKVLSAAAKFLQAADTETRHHAQDLMRFLMTEREDCESTVLSELGMDTWSKIGRMINSIRCEIKRTTTYSQ
jgi:ferritin